MAGTDPQLYTALYITVDSKLLAEATQVQLQRTSNAQNVVTIAKGFAGITLGAGMCTITVQNAVPAADFELDAGQIILTGKPCDFSLVGPGGKQAVVKGFITEDTSEYSANGATGYSFTAVAAMPLFK